MSNIDIQYSAERNIVIQVFPFWNEKTLGIKHLFWSGANAWLILCLKIAYRVKYNWGNLQLWNSFDILKKETSLCFVY